VDNISWLGVGLGALSLFVLGALWYTLLFGKAYREELGVAEPAPGDAPQAPPVKELGGQLLTGLVMAFVLAWLVGAPGSAGHGTLVGLAGGVLVAAALTQFWLFEGRTVRHLAINVGYVVVGLTIAGTIVGAFQAT